MRRFLHRSGRFAALALTLSALAFAGPAARHARAQQSGPGFRGSAPSTVYGPVNLHAGLVVLHGRHNGTANFSAELITQDPDNPVSVAQAPDSAWKDLYPLFNIIGRFDGSAAVIVKTDGEYYLHVGFASGPYELTLTQPSPAGAAPVDQRSFSGKDQQVTPAFRLAAGTITLTATSDNSTFRLWLYYLDDLGGGTVTTPDSVYDGRIIDTSFNAVHSDTTTVSVDIPANGVYLIYADPDGSGSGTWSVTIQ